MISPQRLNPLRALALSAALLMPLASSTGCFSTPPNTPPGALDGLDDPASDEALEARINRDASDMAAWSELIRRRLAERRFGPAKEVIDELIDLRENDYRAWLISADAYRSVGDLVATEDHLIRAHNIAPRRAETNQAMAGFFREVNLPESEFQYWQKFARSFPESSDERAAAQVAVASAAMRANKPEAASEALSDVPSTQPGALALRVRMALANGGPGEALDVIAALDDATLEIEASAALLRLVPFLERIEQTERAEQLCRDALAATERTQARMSALMALWEINFVRLHIEQTQADYHGTYERPIDASQPEQSANAEDAPLMPPGARDVAARIDQIDPTQRDWVVRRWMAACVCSGQSAVDEVVEAQSRMQRLGWPSPPKPARLGEVIAAWQVEDGLRLRAYDRSEGALRELLAVKEDATLLLVHAQVLMESRRFDEALQVLESPLLIEAESLDANRLRLRWLAMIAADQPRQALEEIQASREGGKQPAPANRDWPELDASVLRAASLAVYHAKRLGISLKGIIPGEDDDE